ncbi:MAG: RdgB/HAM1 family non-canonical purine NTP pyrophosphatase [candidate division Zixibacteria bacterium]|nr:RdgB/HAM1 family non-canonical purine NTP pyrophosphatase [Candidatus Tariuqbacter arcticus]
MPIILIATRNKDKVLEINHKLKGLGLEVKSFLDFPHIPEVIEDGKTIEENALKKARIGFFATGLTTLSDDTGIEVEALNGAPGLYSSRYAGDNASYADNRHKLLRELEGIPIEKRRAVFRTVVVIFDKDGFNQLEGRCEGLITEDERGTGGFGYDPIFLLPEYGMTFAEMPLKLKNRVSHRGRAVEKAIQIIREKLKIYPENRI